MTKCKRQRVTLKHWVNMDYRDACNERDEIIRNRFPGYIKTDSFRDDKASHNCDKVTIYGWYSHGFWSNPTCEPVWYYYKPKAA